MAHQFQKHYGMGREALSHLEYAFHTAELFEQSTRSEGISAGSTCGAWASERVLSECHTAVTTNRTQSQIS